MAKPKTPPALQIARTYCEHCSHEVPFNAEICPHCKKTFKSVRCPVCNHQGPTAQFQNGCPSCGHLSHTSHLGRRRSTTVEGRGKKRGKSHDIFIPLMMLFVIAVFGVILYFYLNR